MGHFIRFDVLLLQPGHSPAVCPRCALGAETFGYVLTRYDGGQELRGHCCLDGAQQLLDAMQFSATGTSRAILSHALYARCLGRPASASPSSTRSRTSNGPRGSS